MRFTFFLIIFGGILVASTVVAKDAKNDAGMIDGTWTPTFAKLNGRPFPAETLETMTLILAGGTYTANVGNQTDKGTIKLDPSTKPKAMDIIGIEGPNNGKKILAIYEVRDELLTVCYAPVNNKRPTEFTSTDENKYFLVTYKKKK